MLYARVWGFGEPVIKRLAAHHLQLLALKKLTLKWMTTDPGMKTPQGQAGDTQGQKFPP